MKLARVTHIHCHSRSFDEPETYVWVDEQMTQEEFTAFAVLAQQAYDKAGKDFEEAEKPPYCEWGMPSYEKHPDKTVAEVKAEHEAAQARYKEWEKRKTEAQADFAHHLKAISRGRIVQFWENKPSLDYGLNWGHRHSQRIAHGETTFNDLPGLVEKEESWQ